MPVFEYTAINKTGKSLKGTIDADNSRVARQRLRGQGIFPTAIKEASQSAKTGGTKDVKKYFQANSLGLQELSVATRQLATLIGAGLPLVSALNALSDQTETDVLKRIIVDVREDVEEGISLAKALGKFPGSFPRLYINLVAAGEASGNLDKVMNQLADYLETQLELRRKIFSALMYPVLMLFVCTAVVLALFVFVIPRITEIFEKQNIALPLPTQITIAISHALINFWWAILILVIGAVALFRWYYKQPKGRSAVDRFLLRLPVFGRVYTKVFTARVAGTLGTLLGSGVGLLQGIDITKNIIGNVHVVKALEEARDQVREGKSLASQLSKSGLFPSMLSHMVAIGEKSGALESMLNKAGKSYESEVNNTLEGLTSLLEPMLMLIVGGIVLMIVIAVLMPMTELMNIVG